MLAPSAVLFDAYGTLFDVYSVATAAERLLPGHGAALSALWRDKQIEYTRLVTLSGDDARYRPFWELTVAALRYASLRLGLDLSAQGERTLLDEYRRLQPFAEVRGTLEALHARGIITGILSNGDPPMLEAAVRAAGLEGLLDHVISVDAVRKFKTAPQAYALGTRATGLPAQDILFVSSNGWDVLGATWWGYRTFWVNRQQLPFETLDGSAPERTGDSLADVLAFFPSA